jgi:hypothetical protein
MTQYPRFRCRFQTPKVKGKERGGKVLVPTTSCDSGVNPTSPVNNAMLGICSAYSMKDRFVSILSTVRFWMYDDDWPGLQPLHLHVSHAVIVYSPQGALSLVPPV